MNQFIPGWYIIYTRPKHEKKIYNQLIELGIDVFLPMIRVLRTWSDRKKYVEQPLFPGYLFIYLNDIKTYFQGLEAQGCLYYIKSGNKLSQLKDQILNDLRIATTYSENVEVDDKIFQPGKKVIINEGALIGMSCEIVKHNSQNKFLVRVNILNRNVLLSISKNAFSLQ